MPESSHERADCLWREVVGLTLGDPLVGEAVAKGAMPSMAEDGTAATDREMEVSRFVGFRLNCGCGFLRRNVLMWCLA